jgi:hypothetical protein
LGGSKRVVAGSGNAGCRLRFVNRGGLVLDRGRRNGLRFGFGRRQIGLRYRLLRLRLFFLGDRDNTFFGKSRLELASNRRLNSRGWALDELANFLQLFQRTF